ncbi:tyrosine-type recombinase/integrase [Vibrio parahaemolyticus]|uniref:tyrosine-type recombinase/integrase n=1 Tax=Vibrio parahaemolyticus TaxID=670 RepID=UPI00193D4062|nr:tyrosine-type recombinase/integrase [Vibrio parahaemolyticus]ELA9867449.1 tyrosine-type recombinase/integrase [Vibrio parahaemolyticus]MBM5178867.1 tyrosine-type recombinase/integrase [Vibrio parahaemolyticus]MBM5197661.1 tyrosine-type recombinase/integrase [Vibrio parahaemolyticus]HCG5254617.1 tyrosine-type recombinase/integrase [Vibrio parahaemolyticus]
MTNRTINFTPSAIKALPVPPSTSKANDIEWSDEQTIGLKVLVGRTGNKRYLLRYVSPVTRKKTSIALGRWPDLDVNDARTKARKLKVQIADGIDPKIERDSRSAVVMPDVFTFFHETYLPWAKTRKKSWKDDETRFLRCKPIYKYQMDRLSTHAIMKLQSHLATETYKGKPYSVATNNRVIALVKGLCSLSAKVFDLPNHATKVSLLPETGARERFLNIEETALLIKVARTYYCKVKGNLIALLWLTGCRISELIERKWDDVDFDNRTLFIKTTKNKKPHLVYLSPLMLELLSELQDLKQPGNPYVFPGCREGTHISPPRKALKLILDRAGIDPEGVVFHTARHSVASNLLNSGMDVTSVQRVLNHSAMSSTLIYRHFDKTALERGANALSDMVERASENLVLPEAKVV